MSCFTPLRTFQGLSINKLRTLINDRKIYIWGCGHLGRILNRCFNNNWLSIHSFCDSNPKLNMTYIDNIQVVNPKVAIDLAKQKKAFIIIASVPYKDEIEKECQNSGLVKKEDFLSYIQISRPEVAIDISGDCNLKCPSCPQGNFDKLRPNGSMKASTYVKVLKKLLLELPSMMSIDLSVWGEPFMNPELAEIVQITEKFVPCTLSTNLQIYDQLESVIKAQPSHLIISTSGWGKTYEKNHAGASWQIFLDNIHLLKELINQYNPKSQITVLYHLYIDNQLDELENMRNLCFELGFKLSTTWAYLNPYDKLLDFCEGKSIGFHAQQTLDSLSWDFGSSLKLSKLETNKPCLCQRIFPIINWDLSVILCHIYYNPIIAKNYLDTTLSEVIQLRHNQLQCQICQSHGLHRLDIDLLIRKYSQKDILINQKKGDNIKC